MVESLNEIDVALVTDFEDLAAFMRSVVLQLCSPSLTIRKFAQSPDSATYDPAPGWDVTVTPRVPGGNGFDWILPNTTPAASKTLSTDANGFAQFQWEPDPPEEDSAAGVAEALQPGYIAGRPDGTDFRCELRNEFGDVRVVEGEFTNPANPTFDLDSDRAGDRHLLDVQLLRLPARDRAREGELPDGGARRPRPAGRGHLDLHGDEPGQHAAQQRHGHRRPVRPGRARSRPVARTSGTPVPQNDLLDPGEEWEFECLREAHVSNNRLGGVIVVNTAEVQGNDPTGTVVTDTATDDVDVFVPQIDLVKLVNGQSEVTVLPGTEVTYTYAVTNIGNTPLGYAGTRRTTPRPARARHAAATIPATTTPSWTSARRGPTRVRRIPPNRWSTPPLSPRRR